MEMVVEIFGTMNPSLLYDMQKYHPKAYQKFQNHKNDYLYNVIRDNMQRGIREELYRPEILVDVLSRYRLGNNDAPISPRFSSETEIQPGSIRRGIHPAFSFWPRYAKRVQNSFKNINQSEKKLSMMQRNKLSRFFIITNLLVLLCGYSVVYAQPIKPPAVNRFSIDQAIDYGVKNSARVKILCWMC
jgi:hypothetical protein